MLMCIDYPKITMLYRLHIQGFLCFGLFYMENNQTIVAVRFTPFNHSFYDFSLLTWALCNVCSFVAPQILYNGTGDGN